MGRDYVPIPHIYLEDCEALSDAEFGRLIRALLSYSATGMEPELAGMERFLWNRVKRKQDEYAAYFDGIGKSRHDSAVKAANARWSMRTDANAYERIRTDANECDRMRQMPNINSNININNSSIKEEINKEEKPKRTRFVKPTIEEIQAYCAERQNGIDADRFFAYYESNGWRVGSNGMKDWKAAVRTWEGKDRKPKTIITAAEYAAAHDGPDEMAMRAMARRRAERDHRIREAGNPGTGMAATANE